LFDASKYPISASDILSKVRANKTTIYREIASFVSSGIVKEIDFGDGVKRYESSRRNHHHHLICNSCKKVDDIAIDEDYLLKGIGRNTGFRIQSHSLEFFGLCANCQNA